MHKALFFILFLFYGCAAFNQTIDKNHCSDSSKYRLDNLSSKYSEIEILVNGKWISFDFIEEIPQIFNYKCDELELTGDSIKELVIYWSNSVYGSGGGRIIKGIQIWNLNTVKRIFNEITYCSDESFGRGETPYSFIEYIKEIKIENGILIVNDKQKKINDSKKDKFELLNDFCSLSELIKGKYTLLNDNLELKK